uniref:Putative secreted protein n=1 Tax=Ixodes ricinus TaxID=34613 RepID=A0A6B0UY85_IXORI
MAPSRLGRLSEAALRSLWAMLWPRLVWQRSPVKPRAHRHEGSSSSWGEGRQVPWLKQKPLQVVLCSHCTPAQPWEHLQRGRPPEAWQRPPWRQGKWRQTSARRPSQRSPVKPAGQTQRCARPPSRSVVTQVAPCRQPQEPPPGGRQSPPGMPGGQAQGSFLRPRQVPPFRQ